MQEVVGSIPTRSTKVPVQQSASKRVDLADSNDPTAERVKRRRGEKLSGAAPDTNLD